jgi:hypothetical protein
MRSYKDSLIEYLENCGFSSLSYNWYQYFSQFFEKNERHLQLLQSYPFIQRKKDLNCLIERLKSKSLIDCYDPRLDELEKRYARLIKIIEGDLDRELLCHGKQFVDGWQLFKKSHLIAGSFDYEVLLHDWHQENELPLPDFFAAINRKNSNLNEKIELINHFYNSALKHYLPESVVPEEENDSFDPIYGRKIKINFNSDSDAVKETGDKRWYCSIHNGPVQFFQSGKDLNELNSRAKLSSVEIYGVINGFRRVEITPQPSIGVDSMGKILLERGSLYEQFFPVDKLQYIEQKSLYTTKSFYYINEFDLTIEIKGDYTEEDAALLRQTEFSCFPFYFQESIQRFKWIELSNENSLRIRIKNKNKRTLPIACEFQKPLKNAS